MMGIGSHRELSLQFSAADADLIVEAETLVGAGSFTLTTAAGVTLTPAQRVVITSVGNDSGLTFTVTGTDWNGSTITEDVTGANAGSVTTTRNFASVTSVASDGATADDVTVGTNETGETDAHIIGVKGNSIHHLKLVEGSGNQSIPEISFDDLNPAWNIDGGAGATWQEYELDENGIGKLEGATMIRLKTTAGTALSTLKIVTPAGT